MFVSSGSAISYHDIRYGRVETRSPRNFTHVEKLVPSPVSTIDANSTLRTTPNSFPPITTDHIVYLDLDIKSTIYTQFNSVGYINLFDGK